MEGEISKSMGGSIWPDYVGHFPPDYLGQLRRIFQSGIRMLFKLLNSDINVIRELINVEPLKRLKELMELIKEKTMLPEQKADFDFYRESDTKKLYNHFNNLYWSKNKS